MPGRRIHAQERTRTTALQTIVFPAPCYSPDASQDTSWCASLMTLQTHVRTQHPHARPHDCTRMTALQTIVSSKDSKISKWFGELPAHRLDKNLEPSVAPRLFSALLFLLFLLILLFVLYSIE